jgi:nitrous oxidase accessory protein NosD
VVTSTKLTARDPVTSERCGGLGLSIATEAIVLDCRRLTIAGDGGEFGLGISFSDAKGATVRNCRVMGFETAIRVVGSGNRVIYNELIGNERGILAFIAKETLIAFNVVTGAGRGSGIQILASSEVTVRGNRISGHLRGILADSGPADITRNDVFDNAAGILFDGVGTVTHNVASHNGIGIAVVSPDNVIEDNLLVDNAEDGLFVSGDDNALQANRGARNGKDGLRVAGSGNALRGNVFNDNGGAGICVAPGNQDEGGNRGSRNGGVNVSFACP